MKRILVLLLAAIVCLSFAGCGEKEEPKIYAADVWPFYEIIEVTEENIMEYFELVEIEENDIFGDSTGEKSLILKAKNGFFPDLEEGCMFRVTYTVTTIRYAEGGAGNKHVVDSSPKERDIWISLDGLGTKLVTSYEISDGYIYETQVRDFKVQKAMGKVVAFNQSEIDKLFSLDASGKKSLTIWADDYNCSNIDDSVVGESDDVNEIYKEIYCYMALHSSVTED